MMATSDDDVGNAIISMQVNAVGVQWIHEYRLLLRAYFIINIAWVRQGQGQGQAAAAAVLWKRSYRSVVTGLSPPASSHSWPRCFLLPRYFLSIAVSLPRGSLYWPEWSKMERKLNFRHTRLVGARARIWAQEFINFSIARRDIK